MRLEELLVLIASKDEVLKECKISKQYRILIPTVDIYRKLTGYSPSKESLKELETWGDDVAYWLRVYVGLPTNKLGELMKNKMKEVNRKELVAKQLRILFSGDARPRYVKESYAKAQKLATYLKTHELDRFGNPIQS